MNILSEIGYAALDSARDAVNEHESDAVYNEKIAGIEKATAAMVEAKVKDDKIIEMLQKYWDLRLSEARKFLHIKKNN